MHVVTSVNTGTFTDVTYADGANAKIRARTRLYVSDIEIPFDTRTQVISNDLRTSYTVKKFRLDVSSKYLEVLVLSASR